MPTSPVQKKGRVRKVKAYAIVSKKYIDASINMPWRGFQYFVYENRKAAMTAFSDCFGSMKRAYKVVPCEIVYSLPSPKPKKTK